MSTKLTKDVHGRGPSNTNLEWDVNECLENTHDCSVGQICVNKYLSYECKCPDGFTGVNCSIGCPKALGMENGVISDDRISASSEKNLQNSAEQARLNFKKTSLKEGSWTADTWDNKPWLQIEFDSQQKTNITRVATQGKNGGNAWVTEYELVYIDDFTSLHHTYKEEGQVKVFTGNTDPDTVVYHDLDPPISADAIRFQPISWHETASMRVEVYECRQGDLGGVVSSNDSEIDETPPECVNYSVLDQADRVKSSSGLGTFCDQDIITEPHWYRFMGQAGIFMPNKCIIEGNCNTDMPGWVDGDHPSVAEGKVTRTVCFNGPLSCCNASVEIQIRNCSGFFVYKLVEVPSCPMRYCGAHELDVDECLLNIHNCSGGQICYNRYPSYICRCPRGFTGDNCTIDIEECATNEDKCDDDATCNNTYGSYTCTCNPGYEGNGKQCKDIDECKTNAHNCLHDNDCLNTLGSFRCGSCELGQTQEGDSCVDIDECEADNHNCPPGFACHNTLGSFSCEPCQLGYIAKGNSCVDVDECQADTHDCLSGFLCLNTLGSFSCEPCQLGYIAEEDSCVLMNNSGGISATIMNISKEINNPTIIDRSVKYEKAVTVKGPPDDVFVLKTKLEWRLEQKNDSSSSQLAEGTVVAQETTLWTINRRSIPVGIYKISINVSYTMDNNEVLEASDYGFIKVVKAPLVAVIDGGTSVRWGSKVISSVNGSLSYDGDVGVGTLSSMEKQVQW
ncbi:uncharacterized protein LOC144637066 [Oculina patagonica]